MHSSGHSRFAPPSIVCLHHFKSVRPSVHLSVSRLSFHFFFAVVKGKELAAHAAALKNRSNPVIIHREVEKTQRTYRGVRSVGRDLHQPVGFICSFFIIFHFSVISRVFHGKDTHGDPFMCDICSRWNTRDTCETPLGRHHQCTYPVTVGSSSVIRMCYGILAVLWRPTPLLCLLIMLDIKIDDWIREPAEDVRYSSNCGGATVRSWRSKCDPGEWRPPTTALKRRKRPRW